VALFQLEKEFLHIQILLHHNLPSLETLLIISFEEEY
jgi:hypothetical protein